MKKSFMKLVLGLFLMGAAAASFAQDRKPWKDVPNPKITSVVADTKDPKTIVVNFDLDTPRDNSGADKAIVYVSGPGKATAEVGKTRNKAKKAMLELKQTGTYTVIVKAFRNNEKEAHESEPATYTFKLPLTKPSLSVLNVGDSTIEASWNPVDEATGYVVSYTDKSGKKLSLPETKDFSAKITGLAAGSYSKISVTANRGADSSVSDTINKLVTKDAERIWAFTEFGTSTNPERNRFEMIDSNDLKVKLYSCTFNPKTQTIIDKGGKYESFFDGMSFYYTKIDPRKENFELTCTVTVDYHNPMADGQEGFGVLALDQLGVDGEPMIIAYNNSTGIVSRKFTTHVNGVKKEIKDGIGYRAVTGITEGIIAEGEAAVKAKCSSIYQAFSYDQAGDAVKTGDVYRVTLKKDNTGYHSIYKRAIASEGTVEEYIMYDTKNKKLLQLDDECIYVGFSVARGCNATFSDVVFKTSDPKNDPPALPEPPELVPLKVTIDCPSTYTDKNYPFAMITNAKGTVHIEDNNGKVLVNADPVDADKYYRTTLKVKVPSVNDYNVTFTPEQGWHPGENMVIAQYDAENAVYVENYKPVSFMHSVSVITFKGSKLYVGKNGSIFGKGTESDPIDLDSAIKYCQPGQTLLLLPGSYYPPKSIEIERGNNGTAKKRKVLKSADPNNRAVLDYSMSKASVTAFNLFGDYWTIENIDITKTPGDCKALQIGGNYNEIRMVDTYLNGDTGIQIAGRSAESSDMWPHHNIIYGCESFGNSDPAQNNADGFASKLTSGEGNKFINCVSHHNVDDGWDLYSKIETGPIGAVLLENCIAYANGTKLDLSGKGDGNGFKLGGDGIAIKHILRNSVSWGNGTNGVTCNSNPALILDRVTVFGSEAYNIALYGKGKAEQYPRIFEANGVLSVNGGMGDNIKEKPELAAENNFFFNGAASQNSKGAMIDPAEAFVSVDTNKYYNGYNADGTFNRIPRNDKGVFDLGDLFKTTDKVPSNVGARYNGTIDAK
ncbi:MAG: fibronectin type III domain-containing protein [Treponema sp.]|nr:fibronectin type III domain-containing protein [Candidatus Treponema equifaecale]